MRLLFDIETDGLQDTVTTTWCIWTVDVDTGDERGFRPDQIADGVKYIGGATELIGHNIIRYDLPVLKKLYGFDFCGTVTDTLVMSQVIYPDLTARDTILRAQLKRKGIIMPSDILGSHALKAWGYRLGNRKLHYEDWSKFTEEMYMYCRQDIRANLTLYKKMVEKNFSQKALDVEHKIHTEFVLMQELGINFDVPAATQLYAEITEKAEAMKAELIEAFPPKIIQLKTKQKVIPFNPGSRQQIGEALIGWGWIPPLNTQNKPYQPGDTPKLDELSIEEAVKALKDKIPAVALLNEYLLLSKRLGQLGNGKNAWLKLETDGVIHGQMNHMGAVTSRCSHARPNLGQVPAVYSPYGKECRTLFIPPPGWVMVGSDLSGLELRMLAHYMFKWDSGAYGDVILNGDIHTHNQEAGGIDTRDTAKKFIYAFLYGAQAGKISEILGCTKKHAERVMAKFIKAIPALGNLKSAVENAAKRGYLIGLDGRHIPIRSAHAALNTLLQGAGAVVSKYWYVGIADALRERGLRASIRLYVHDEVQCVCHPDDVDKLTPIFQEVLTKVEKDLNINIPLGCEFKVGNNWAETH